MRRLDLGQLFNRRYRILGAVGSGPLSVLYRARDEVHDALVALKVPSARATGDALCHETRLLDEGILGLQLAHENVVRTIDCDIAECSTPYVAVEWLDGEPLLELVDREGPLSSLHALCLVREAATGLAVLHECGYVHCDVKPDNLFLSAAEGGRRAVKVLDFGLARPMGQRPGGDEHVVAGTLQYIAPEQAANEALDARADIYSLGVVLFRLLTGELPFDTRSPTALLGHHLFSAPPPPSWLCDHGSCSELDKIVLTALRKDPSNRYPSMSELIADIDRFAGGEPILGRAEPSTDRYEPRSEHARRAMGIIARTARILDASAIDSSAESGVGAGVAPAAASSAA